jgi:hypothetical protein
VTPFGRLVCTAACLLVGAVLLFAYSRAFGI